MLDTPGTLWPKIDDEQMAENLAFIGSIRNEVVDMGELAISLLAFCKKNYPSNLKEKYLIEDMELTPIEMLDHISEIKHYLLKGAEPDYDRTCFAIIDDFRKGKLGKICLDAKRV